MNHSTYKNIVAIILGILFCSQGLAENAAKSMVYAPGLVNNPEKSIEQQFILFNSASRTKIGPQKMLEVVMDMSGLASTDMSSYQKINTFYNRKRLESINLLPPDSYMLHPFEDVVNLTDAEEPIPSFMSDEDNLSDSDVVAFINSLQDFDSWGEEWVRIYSSPDIYEKNTRQALIRLKLLNEANWTKYLAAPCASAGKHLKSTGQWESFDNMTSKFGLEGNKWIATCDRVIRAYRIAKLNSSQMQQVLDFKKFHDYNTRVYGEYDLEKKPNIKIFLDILNSINVAFSSPSKDVDLVLPYIRDLSKRANFFKRILSIPILDIN